jgi:hypothetical protein
MNLIEIDRCWNCNEIVPLGVVWAALIYRDFIENIELICQVITGKSIKIFRGKTLEISFYMSLLIEQKRKRKISKKSS